MAAALARERLRPHVKAFKSTALAARLAEAGHRRFCCATVREVEGMAAAGLGDDLLLANEVLDCRRLTPIVRVGRGPDHRRRRLATRPSTPRPRAGIPEVLIDVNVGLPRCGCDPADAGRLADLARDAGLIGPGRHGLRGPPDARAGGHEGATRSRRSMELLLAGRTPTVGGDVVSGGGTGTYDINTWVTELQAGSYCLMDTEYVPHAPGFQHALFVWTTVISRHSKGWGVLDAGLKALGHGPRQPHSSTAATAGSCPTSTSPSGSPSGPRVPVGDRVRVVPAHVDPTVRMHERLHVVDGDEVVEVWDVDLRGW